MENYWYKKEYAQLISLIAVLLMVVHHFFGFKNNLLSDVSWTPLCKLGGIEVERIVGAFGKICVSLYAFNTGYAMWVNSGNYQKKRCDVNRILKFLVSYWVVCLLFYLYAIAVGDCNPSGKKLLLTLVGQATSPKESYVNVSFAWYVSYYILFIACARLWLRLFSTNHQSFELFVVFMLYPVLYFIPENLSFLSPLPLGLFGIYVAKHHVFEFLSRHLRTLPLLLLVGFVPIFILIRQGSILLQERVSYLFIKSIMGGVELFIVPLFIYIIIRLVMPRIKVTGTMFRLCSLSMNVWFLHSLFFSGHCVLQPLLYFPKYSILVLIWGLTLLLPAAWLISRLQKALLHMLLKTQKR